MANWIGVITNGGNDLLNEWVSQRELRFDSAAAGTGTVAVASMMAQTQLVSRKQEASILGADRVDGGVRLKLRVTAHETGYTLNQYGVWASLTGGDSILIALFQHEQGIQVPSKSESQDFVYTFYALIGCSNTGTWTVNIDTSAVVSGAEMDRAIAEATNGLQPKITTSGLLKGDGKGNITAAAGGTDYAWPTLSGSGAPTETTKGETMQRYHDTDTDKEYVCTGKSADGKYVWKLSGGGDEVPAHASNHATGGSDPITPADIGAIPASDKGKAGGVATLDSSGKVPSGQIPSLEYAGKTHAGQHAADGSDPISPESIGAAQRIIRSPNIADLLEWASAQTQSGAFYVDPSVVTANTPEPGVWFNGFIEVGIAGPGRITLSTNDHAAKTYVNCVSSRAWQGWAMQYSDTVRPKPKDIGAAPALKCVHVTLSAAGWHNFSQTAATPGVLEDETKQLITPTPSMASQDAYHNAGIRCTAQAADELTFTAKKIPTDDLTVYVTIQEVGA